MSGLTWARNERDDHTVKAGEMFDHFLKLKTGFEEKHGKPLKAVRLSRPTLLTIPLSYPQEPGSVETFYGVPIEIDDSRGLWEFKEVYA